MALFGGVQRRYLPGQIAYPDPALSLWILIVTTTKRTGRTSRSARAAELPTMHQVCGTSDFEIGRGYLKQTWICRSDRSSRRQRRTAD